MMHKSQFQKIDPHAWFCAPGSHTCNNQRNMCSCFKQILFRCQYEPCSWGERVLEVNVCRPSHHQRCWGERVLEVNVCRPSHHQRCWWLSGHTLTAWTDLIESFEMSSALIHDKLFIKTFWEQKINTHSHLTDAEDERMKRSALTKWVCYNNPGFIHCIWRIPSKHSWIKISLLYKSK